MFQFSSVQPLTCVRLFATPWTVTCQASLSITNSWNAQTHVHQVSDVIHHHLISYPCHLIFCRPLLHLPSIFPSLRVFFNESVLCIKWPKYWIFSLSLSPSNEYSGLISFRIDWLDILAVQGLYLLISFRRILEILWNLCRQLCHFANKKFCLSFQSV